MGFLRLLILCAVCLPALAQAQVQVLGVELGTSTLQQVKAQLGRQTRIEATGTNKFSGGPQFSTDGGGYGIDGLSGVLYIFDTEQKLAGVEMEMNKRRFDEIFSFLAGKYKTTTSERPVVGNRYARFKAKGVTIELEAPHLSFVMQARYVGDDLLQQFKAVSAEEARQKQAAERSKF
jgi:hypothetical protein